MLPIPIIDIEDRPILIFWLNEKGEAEAAFQASNHGDGLYSFAAYVLDTFRDWKDKDFYIVPCREDDFDNVMDNICSYQNKFENNDLNLPEAFTLKGKEFLSEESFY